MIDFNTLKNPRTKDIEKDNETLLSLRKQRASIM